MEENKRISIYFSFNYLNAIVMAATTTIQLLMCSYCTYIYTQSTKEIRSKRRLYIGFSLAIFFFNFFGAVCNMKYYFDMFMGPKTLPEALELEAKLNSWWYSIAASWADDIVLLLGDGLLIYRCFIVWTGRRMITVLPIALHIGTLAAIIWGEVTSIGSVIAPKALQEAYLSLSAAANCTVALLIGGKLWEVHRRNTKLHVTPDSKTYLSVIGIVAESALPFALASIFVAACYTQAVSHPSSWKSWKIAENISFAVWYIISVLSPQLIIWRVTLGRLFAHSTTEGSIVSSLAFNHNTVNLRPHASDLEGGPSAEEVRMESGGYEDKSTANTLNSIEVIHLEKDHDHL